MTPSARAALISWAKRNAVPVHSCVTASLRPDHLIGEASPEQLAALVAVLAAAADPARLRQVTEAPGDVIPVARDRGYVLRYARKEAARLRRAHEPVPREIRRLELEYWQERYRQKIAAREGRRAA